MQSKRRVNTNCLHGCIPGAEPAVRGRPDNQSIVRANARDEPVSSANTHNECDGADRISQPRAVRWRKPDGFRDYSTLTIADSRPAHV